jgi:hypothetical protein
MGKNDRGTPFSDSQLWHHAAMRQVLPSIFESLLCILHLSQSIFGNFSPVVLNVAMVNPPFGGFLEWWYPWNVHHPILDHFSIETHGLGIGNHHL